MQRKKIVFGYIGDNENYGRAAAESSIWVTSTVVKAHRTGGGGGGQRGSGGNDCRCEMWKSGYGFPSLKGHQDG